MIAASIVLAALCGMSLDPDIAALVEQLGSAKYVQRQEASEALEKRGKDALPALRAARESKDPEVRARAVALIDKIENLLMIQPTMVGLDFENVPLPEVVKEISARSGIPLTLVPENSPIWQSRRVTLKESQPVSFWVALDGLCRGAHLQQNPAIQGAGGPRGTVIQLFAGGNTPTPVPSSDHGPFRVNVLGIHYQRDLRFGQNNQVFTQQVIPGVGAGVGGNRGVNEQFYIDLQVLAEPRMVLTQNGPLKLTEVVDANGQSLLVPENSSGAMRHSGFMGYSSGLTTLQMPVQLKYPEKPSRMIRRIRGTLPVMVSARKDGAMVVNLADAKGKTFKNEDVTLTVHDVIQAAPNQQSTSIDISFHSNNLPDDDNGPAGRFGGASIFSGMNSPQNQMEILDANDRPYPQWYPSKTRIDNDEARMTLVLMQTDGIGPPAKIRYYEMARATTDVPFEFNNVEMP